MTQPGPREVYERWLRELQLHGLHLTTVEAYTERAWIEPAECRYLVSTSDAHWDQPSHRLLRCTLSLRVQFFSPPESVVAMADAPECTDSDPHHPVEIAAIRNRWTAFYGDPSHDMTDARFSIFRDNVLLHVWPLFRQQVRTMTSDFGWAPFTLPLHHRASAAWSEFPPPPTG